MRSAPFVAIVGLLVLGCHAPPPAHEWTGADDALRTMRERGGAVHELSARCAVLLEDERDAVRLDGELVARRDGRLRARLHKLGRPVVDVTVRGDELWVHDTSGHRDDGRATDAAGSASLLRRVASVLWGPVGEWTVIDEDAPDRLELRRVEPTTEREVVCVVDRVTLTARRYVIPGGPGEPDRLLALDGYRATDDFVWPARIVGVSGSRRLVLELYDVHFDDGVPARAFEPPPGARKIP